ncbi:MAG: polysaccharide deacetylase family protein [Bacteroidetes bacterium]|nr:polysaccharide deacetylase family protein [Bacteroidota bacterium]MCW5894549.1 polysaccharide deacetylase family protein [Bacteroidota bacterium]
MTLLRRGVNAGREMMNRIITSVQHKGIILMYHRIAEMDVDPWYLCVSPENFAAQLEVLRKRARPMSLQKLAAAVHEGNVPPRAVAVTFDDGYANNLYTAKPLLERYDTPATVFVTTGYLGSQKEYWWDELDQALLQPGTLPPRLSLSMDNNTRDWNLGAASSYTEGEYRNDCARGTKSPRLNFYYSVWEWLRPLPDVSRRMMLDAIVSWAGKESCLRPTHRSLLHEEVVTLALGGLVEVGPHTVSHAMLSHHPEDVQRREIEESKKCIENLLSADVASFSYPFGRYDATTVSIVKQAGFSAACTVENSTIQYGSDPLQLPRFGVFDMNGRVFERQLLQWLKT